MTKWYQLSVDVTELSGGKSFTYAYQVEKNELYVSPHLKLSGLLKAAHIKDRHLAKKFLDKCLPIFKKRYGEFTEISIIECSSGGSDKRLIKRIEQHSAIIEARIKHNNYASNKKVIIE